MTNSGVIRVLVVEDSEDDALMLERELKRGGFEPKCFRVDTAEAMREALQMSEWDIIIADYSLPQFSGLGAFQIYRDAGLDIPFIIVSGTIGEELAVAAMKAGVHDYILKESLARLVPAIRRELRDAEERSARRRAEEKLKQTKNLRIIGEFTSSLFHDLKNPLQVILTSGEFLCSDFIKPGERPKYGKVIERQVQRVLSMTQDVLDFVKGEVRLNVKQVNVTDLVLEIVESNQTEFAEAGVTLLFDNSSVSGKKLIITADEQKIWRVLQNLISNAKDAMPDGGQVTIMIEESDEQVTIEVADTGNGIPVSIRETLFQPFVSTGKEHGTGLGLAIVKSAIDAHGGSVSFDVREGIGTTFRITLPKRPARIKEREINDASAVSSDSL